MTAQRKNMSSVRVPMEPTEPMLSAAGIALDRIANKPGSWRDLITAQYKAMLAAAPESPPVEGLVGRLNDEASKQITFSSDLTAPYVGQLLREAASALTAIPAREDVSSMAVESALEVAMKFGGIDGDHHKAWVIDQMCRMLLGDRYTAFVAEAKDGEDGSDTYEWNEGIAP